ncbi:MAG: PLP-dependent aminotransferase family protein [Methanobacteriaceae archaeon]|nr:PLP-dependent aminotransferase family protein [Methanobacteriaceae archaeon]
MKFQFADRMSKVPRSFVRETLKITEDPEIISFAGGLPSPLSFPVEEIAESTSYLLKKEGEEALQYSTTEGYTPLREYLSNRYSKKGVKVDADHILITNGSQQCLDLVGKVFLNQEDKVLVERPTYLAAIQAFRMYEAQLRSIPLQEDGIDIQALSDALSQDKFKLFYSIPSFQNPTGITYSLEKRKMVAEILEDQPTVFVEDNPYGEIRFRGEDLPPIKSYLADSILFGTFSKIISPGMRMGWMVAPLEVMDKLVVAKQASDLHSNYFTQRVIYQHLTDHNMDHHLQKIRKMYKKQRDLMIQMIEDHFPPGVRYTQPEGGMFLWVTLPEGLSALELFDIALKEKVAFVPGEAFYTENPEKNTLRLNFSNSNEERIEEGMKRLGNAINKMMDI